ncbi:hypothetical protein PM082_002479 [Marasmius tenuissimus]|nr:hypothetical protein PM082_002479 [Marasmius tenuissimus]
MPRTSFLHPRGHHQRFHDTGSCHTLRGIRKAILEIPIQRRGSGANRLLCATLLVLAFAKCGTGSKEEEILDTLLLVARNVLQFSRLAAVMRQSGQSIFTRPKPIDINTARRAGFGLDIDIESDDEEDGELGRPLVRHPVVFEADDEGHGTPYSDDRHSAIENPVLIHGIESEREAWASSGR